MFYYSFFLCHFLYLSVIHIAKSKLCFPILSRPSKLFVFV